MAEPDSAREPEHRARPARVQSARWSLGPLLTLTRTVLGMDLVLLTEVAGPRETVLRLEGSWPGIDTSELEGRSLPIADTFCQRLLEGKLPAFVADVPGDPTTAHLRIARTFGVSAWLGALVPTRGDRVFVLCCLAREPRPTLGQRDVLALSTLSVSIAGQIDTSAIGP